MTEKNVRNAHLMAMTDLLVGAARDAGFVVELNEIAESIVFDKNGVEKKRTDSLWLQVAGVNRHINIALMTGVLYGTDGMWARCIISPSSESDGFYHTERWPKAEDVNSKHDTVLKSLECDKALAKQVVDVIEKMVLQFEIDYAKDPEALKDVKLARVPGGAVEVDKTADGGKK